MVKVYVNETLLWDEVSVADTMRSRFIGLMGKKYIAANEGLLIMPCNQVHTFHMRFPIDIIYLSKDMEIVGLQTLPPGKIGEKFKSAFYVLETTAGSAENFKLTPGNTLKISNDIKGETI